MFVAVSAWFDAISESEVRTVWKRMADAEVDASLHLGPYRPHLTLTLRAIGIFPPSVIDRIGLVETPVEVELACVPLVGAR